MADRRVVYAIARREAVDIARDGRFRWSAGLLLLMLLASLAACLHRAVELRAIRETAQREERQRWISKGRMLPHPAMHFGLYVYQPFLDLAAVDDGIEPYVGAYALVEAHEQKIFQDRPVADEIPTRRLTDLTPALCLEVLAPLLIISLAFATFAGERERGTWRLILSTGVARRAVVVGKMCGVVVPLIVVLVPAAAIGAAAIVLNTPPPRGDVLVRVALLAAAYVAFFGIYVALTLAASLAASTSRQALLVAVTFWFVTTLLVPFAAIHAGRAMFPSPTSFQFAAEILNAKSRAHYPTARQVEAELLATYGASSVPDLPVDPTGVLLMRQMAIDDPIYDAALGRLHETYRRQARILHGAAALSPSLAMQAISMNLAGTDLEAHLHFAAFAARYRHVMETILNEDATYNLTPGPRDRELWEQIPPFTYVVPPVAATVRHATAPLVLLSTWLALSSALCAYALTAARS